MLQQLFRFHSQIRFKLLRFFLTEESGFYFLSEISERIREKNSSLQKELKNLEKIGLIEGKEVKTEQKVPSKKPLFPVSAGKSRKTQIKAELKNRKKLHKAYQVNTNFFLYQELKMLFLKSRLLLEEVLAKKIQKIGHVRLLILTGFFTNLSYTQTDLLIVGRVNRKKLKNLIKRFEKDLGRSINYTVMSTQEFKYRHDLTDQFLFNILENRKVVVVDRMKGLSQPQFFCLNQTH